ncbi:MAG: c-type cytochrome biogenesis protein CcmI [Alphaproteobacteria bacterium]|nr:MAG: c-type cytochrome biogenesis protein CcmI [Alphaproteobacteria bacterium]
MSGDLVFWIGAGLLTAVVVVLLLRPLFRGAGETAARSAYDLAVYRDQLAELDRDIARGVLSPEQAAAARLEIERRILAAAGPEERPAPAAARSARAPRWVAAALAVALPALALSVYVQLGAPGLLSGSARLAAPDAPGAEAPDDLVALADQLAKRMAETPDDPRGWLLLARSYAALGRYQDSATAYAAAISHGAAEGPQGAEVQAAYGEALAASAGGQITVAAQAAFEAALAIDPAEPRARFYLALAEAQKGRVQEALDAWVALEAEAPADAPWRPAVTAQIEQAAAALGLDPATLPGRAAKPAPTPGFAPGPSEEEMEAAAEMTPEERDAFIRGMVDRLADRLESDPDDLDGWIRLARAHAVLGDSAKAQEAWARAAALAPGNVDVLLSYAQAIREAHVSDAAMPAEFAETVAQIRALAPDDPLGLYLAGLVASEAGDPATARQLWRELAARLPEGSPERTELEARIAALPGS